ncbi:MAG: hypothetical protein H0W83_07490, partial [Planctomycetes bacterium]|nr:hypothetical protein [Planctomycetota bacterium]
ATTLGDFCAQKGDQVGAAEQYGRVADGLGPLSLRQEARYKQGLSQLRGGQSDQAFATWKDLSTTPWSWLVEMHRLDQAFAEGRYDEVYRELPGLYARCDRVTRDRVACRLAKQISAIRLKFEKKGDRSTLEAFIRLHDQVLTDTRIADLETATALNALGRFDEVFSRFSIYPVQISEALTRQGRYEEVLERYPDKPDIAADALYAMGRGLEIVERYRICPSSWKWTLLETGRIDEFVAIAPNDTQSLFMSGRLDELARLGDVSALIALGRVAEVPEKDRLDSSYLIATNQHELATSMYGQDAISGWYVRFANGLERWIGGDRAGAEQLWEMDRTTELVDNGPYTLYYLLLPFIHELGGDHQAIARMRAWVERPDRRWAYGQKPRFLLRYVCGEIDDAEFLAHPYRALAEAHLLLCRAIVAERAGRPVEAAQAYHAFQALPPWKRYYGVDPATDRFIRWRIAELQR